MMQAGEGAERVLVVDDDNDVCETLCEQLKGAGYQTVGTNGGKAALEALKRQQFSLVLLDIIMPDKDGLETLVEMRRAAPSLKVIAMSGHQWHRGMDVLGWSRRLGACGVLAKPFRRNELLTHIAEVLGKGEGQPS